MRGNLKNQRQAIELFEKAKGQAKADFEVKGQLARLKL